MIPYQELAAALERWRVKQGLPTGTAMLDGGTPASGGSVTAAVAPPIEAEPLDVDAGDYVEADSGDAGYGDAGYGEAAPPAYAQAEPAYGEAPAYAQSGAPAYGEAPAYAQTEAPAYAQTEAPAYAQTEAPAGGETYDEIVDDLGDADVVEDDQEPAAARGPDDYDDQGDDFAVSFGQSAAGTIGATDDTSGTIDDDGDEERTQIGPMANAMAGDEAGAEALEPPPPAGDEWPDPKTWNAQAGQAWAQDAAEQPADDGLPPPPTDDDGEPPY